VLQLLKLATVGLGLGAAALGLAGCCSEADTFVSDAAGCEDTFCGDPVVDVGGGVTGYEPLEDGDGVPLNFGPQGGYHIDVSSRMDGLCPIVRIDVALLDDDGDEISREEHRVQAVRDGAGTVQDYWGLTAILPCGYWPTDGPYDGPNPPDCPDGIGLDGQVGGQTVRLVVEATDDNDRVGRGELLVVPSCCSE